MSLPTRRLSDLGLTREALNVEEEDPESSRTGSQQLRCNSVAHSIHRTGEENGGETRAEPTDPAAAEPAAPAARVCLVTSLIACALLRHDRSAHVHTLGDLRCKLTHQTHRPPLRQHTTLFVESRQKRQVSVPFAHTVA